MNIILATREKLASLLGTRPDQAEQALHDSRSASLALSRRMLFGGTAAVAAGTVFGFVEPNELNYSEIMERALEMARRHLEQRYMPIRVEASGYDPESKTVSMRVLLAPHSMGFPMRIWDPQ